MRYPLSTMVGSSLVETSGYGWPPNDITSHITMPNDHLTKNIKYILLPTGSEEREVLGIGSILVAIPPSCQIMKSIVSQLHTKNMAG